MHVDLLSAATLVDVDCAEAHLWKVETEGDRMNATKAEIEGRKTR